MSDETLMWLLPVVFMLHDFEEIVMMPPWLSRHGGEVVARYPFAKAMLARVRGLSGSAYAFAVAVVFVLVAGVTLVSVLAGWPGLWAAAVAVLGLHFVVHIGQFLVWRGYVPVIVTSVPGLVWCVWALAEALDRGMVGPGDIWPWMPFAVVVTLVWLVLAHRMAHGVDAWLRRRFGGPVFSG
jgi:hypothetical protein